VRDKLIQRVLPATAVIGVALVFGPPAAAMHNPARAVTTRKVTLATFAGSWLGHSRHLTITRNGHAKESIGSGCCDPIIDLQLGLTHPQGTSSSASVAARVIAVRVHDHTAFTKSNPAPRVGSSARLHLKRGVLTEPLTRTTYCTLEAQLKSTCGA
jgi:hypothetical protein